MLMRDRDKANRVLRLVPAPHSDGQHGESKTVIDPANDRERPCTEVDESDPDPSTGTSDAGPLFW
jgi:hypothetical protein